MRNAQVAEWILSLVTTPERAAATVGDLMEDGVTGAFRFWIGVLWTALSMLWRGLSDDPARMMGLAIRAFVVQFGMLLGILLAFVIGAGLLGLIAGLFWDPTKAAVGPNPQAHAIGTMLGAGVGMILIPFQVGRWLAWKSPGRELVPVLAFAIVGFVIATSAGLIWERDDNLFHFILSLVNGFAWNMLLQIPTFAGAVWVRRKRWSH